MKTIFDGNMPKGLEKNIVSHFSISSEKPELVNKIERSKAVDSYDIKVLVDENGDLIQPIYIGTKRITKMGLYEVYGKK